ncbi:hypothetical protein L4D20_05760 [Vibrio kyushuensis]|uniref:hypothetical protein n=1 Tax=Vibrio kyushuensis TaxID=2910249 RepID=UPI003D0C345E
MIKRLFSSTAFLLCLPVLTFTLTYGYLKRPDAVRELQNASLIEKDRARLDALAYTEQERALIDLVYQETDQAFVIYPTLFVTRKDRITNHRTLNVPFEDHSSVASAKSYNKLFSQICFIELYSGMPYENRLKSLAHELGHCVASRQNVTIYALIREFDDQYSTEIEEFTTSLKNAFLNNDFVQNLNTDQIIKDTMMRHYEEVLADVLGVYLAAKVQRIHPSLQNQFVRRNYALKGGKERDGFWYHSNWYFQKISQQTFSSIKEVHLALLRQFRKEYPLPPMMIVKESLIRQLKNAHQLDARFLVDDAHNKQVWAYLMAHYPEEYVLK